jgi:hypothetical protein
MGPDWVNLLEERFGERWWEIYRDIPIPPEVWTEAIGSSWFSPDLMPMIKEHLEETGLLPPWLMEDPKMVEAIKEYFDQFRLQHGGGFTVPSGYPNDSFFAPLRLTSGEEVTVTPRGQGRDNSRVFVFGDLYFQGVQDAADMSNELMELKA